MGWFLLLAAAAILSSLYVALVAFLSARYPETHWDWSALDWDDIAFPDGFVWGVAAAAHQVEGGCDNNNWSRWENQTAPDGTPRISRGQKAGRACDHWNRYGEDIQLITELGVTSYRFSPAWSKLEPEPGRFDDDAIKHYHDVLDAMKQAGVTPMLTLHHFTHPLWFEDMGGFEKEDNIAHFVRFAERLFAEYRDKIELWCTINEPAVFAAAGWFQGRFPPGKENAQLTAEVLANLMTAHVRVYEAVKAMPGGDNARIGLVKNIFQFDPSRRYHLADWVVARTFDHVFNGAILACLKTGRFRVRVPGQIAVERDLPGASASLDFVGLNYYSHFHLRSQLGRDPWFRFVERPGDIQTDMDYAIYAEGFHRALVQIAELGLPIYVTENGVADARDDRRALYIRRYLYAMSRAIDDGADVRGYYYWSLMDNFEWAEGYDMKFGLYSMDPATLERKLRDGARAYTMVVQASRELD
ncbi:MAG: glycoside hydrolase family 1 protein [Proteobacteria bacterium]|nr:glycoside hydrolase family 1 protein [Pseudomonadota bacterium]